jgi:integrase/recombinase XerD
VRGPKHLVNKGKPPVLDGDEGRRLLDSIDTSTVVRLRDRALIALLIYTFARVSAALHMNVEDYYLQGKRWWVWLHEKGGKQHEIPHPPPVGYLRRRLRDRRRHRRRQDISPFPYARRPRA